MGRHKVRKVSVYIPQSFTLLEKLAALSMPEPNSGCRLWISTVTPAGYGQLSFAGVRLYAHQAAWSCKHGPIPKGKWILHHCDVRCCIEEPHLYAGDVRDNVNDMMARERNKPVRGERHGLAKLSAEHIPAILADTRSQRAIALDYGVSHNTIGYVKRGEVWKHIRREQRQ